MSIEQAIAAHTAAVEENTVAVRELMAALNAGGTASTGAADTAKATKSTKTTKQADVDKEVGEATTSKAPKHTQEELFELIKKTAKTVSKEQAQQTYQSLGYDKMAEIKPEHIDQVFEACSELLEGGDDL